ncbi:hypothetical protein PMAC_002874 [Pneumocystis sp. 'macacae']|nr:hypothetical protein PMAC_002874 [Pneumocystis sp. 'macacae']
MGLGFSGCLWACSVFAMYLAVVFKMYPELECMCCECRVQRCIFLADISDYKPLLVHLSYMCCGGCGDRTEGARVCSTDRGHTWSIKEAADTAKESSGVCRDLSVFLCISGHFGAIFTALSDRPSTLMVMASLFFKTPVDVDIRLDGEDSRKMVDIKVGKDRRQKAPLYYDGESVKGSITLRPKDGRRMEHSGIKVQFIGSIEMFFDRGTHYEFLSLVQELAAPGEMRHPQTFNFEFKNVEKQYESYHGINVKLRYFLRVIISRRMPDIVGEKDIWVYSYKMPPENNSSIKMDVGILNKDLLFFLKKRYHLKDVIVGKIHFLLVRLKIKYMELSIVRRETTGSSPNQYNESETISRFEIMDGQPVRGETIPIRLFLGGFDLTPTFRDVNKKFSTRYYLSLVLIDEDARRYFKQSEITLYRID